MGVAGLVLTGMGNYILRVTGFFQQSLQIRWRKNHFTIFTQATIFFLLAALAAI